ncbi:hypothetical protein LINGRAHAP2_LOCUS18614 [Linum grandiflorum]
MIKRQFYRLDHGDNDEPSSDSSSSSDSDADVEVEAAENSDSDAVSEDADSQDGNSTPSGYISEDSSANEIDGDPSGSTDEDDASEDERRFSKPNDRKGVSTTVKGFAPADMPHCVLQFKSVYRCRICPRIICLTDQTMRVHLASKRHARSEKLLKENRLKVAMNSDGEIENQETPAEMNARILAIAAEKPKNKSKNRGRQRQKNRMKKKKSEDGPKVESKTKESTGGLAKKRQKK